MDRRDQELLDKQLRTISPPRNDGLLGLAGVAMFVAGLVLGASLFAPQKPQAAPHGAMAAMSFRAPSTVDR